MADDGSAPPNSSGRSRSGRLTSRDIAAAAGVSQATVSNVLNRPDVVAAATRERVHAVMRSSNFVINDSARSLRAGRSRTLGVVALDLSNPFWGEVTRGVSDAAAELGYTVLLGSSGESRVGEQKLLRAFEEHRVDSVLVSSVDVGSPEIASLGEHGIRVVLLDELDPTGEHSSVSLDQAAGARMLGAHLIEQGHRRIGFLNVPHSVWWARERSLGLQEAVVAAALDPGAVLTERRIPTMTATAAEAAITRLLADAPDITAIACANDMVALGVLKRLLDIGVRVPQDLSLVGFDDSYFAAMLSPALTTVRQQPYRLGRTGAELAIERRHGDPSRTVIFEPELVVRESGSAPRPVTNR